MVVVAASPSPLLSVAGSVALSFAVVLGWSCPGGGTLDPMTSPWARGRLGLSGGLGQRGVYFFAHSPLGGGPIWAALGDVCWEVRPFSTPLWGVRPIWASLGGLGGDVRIFSFSALPSPHPPPCARTWRFLFQNSLQGDSRQGQGIQRHAPGNFVTWPLAS